MNIKYYQTVIEEFESYAEDCINENIINLANKSDWHFHLFNRDYYIIGYYQCSEWLKKHDIAPFEAVGTCQEYEKDNFGEVSKIYDNSEITVNMLTYILGEEWLNSEGTSFILKKIIERGYKEKNTFDFDEVEEIEDLIENGIIDTDVIADDFRDWVLQVYNEYIKFEYEDFQNLLTFTENYENLKQ